MVNITGRLVVGGEGNGNYIWADLITELAISTASDTVKVDEKKYGLALMSLFPSESEG